MEATQVKIDPITAKRPTNAELAKGINQVHDCLEEHKRSTSRAIRGLRRKTEIVERDVKEIKSKVTSSPFTQPQWKQFYRQVLAVITALGALIFLLKVMYFAWPGVEKAALELWKAVVEGIF